MNLNNRPAQLTLAHTPDADDAFMLYALTAEKITSAKLTFKHVIKPIQELNLDAMQGLHDLSALSLGAYPHVCHLYSILPCGACMGFKYGPMLLSKKPLSKAELRATKVAIPGTLTTAYLTLRLYDPELSTVEVRFDQIPEAIQSGEVGAGLVIHEAQLTYERLALTKLVDLGEWWHDETGLPLPLGGNIVRRSLGKDLIHEVIQLYQDAIRYSLAHKKEALAFAMQYARGIPEAEADKFIGMYVNESTVDYGETGKSAVDMLFKLAYERGVLKNKVAPEFVTV